MRVHNFNQIWKIFQIWLNISVCVCVCVYVYVSFSYPEIRITHIVGCSKSSHISLMMVYFFLLSLFIYFSFIFISWRLITSQHWSGFCHTLTWISHGVTCIPNPDPPSHLPPHQFLWVFPVHQARALVSCIQPGLVICFTIGNIHAVLLKYLTLAFSHRVQKIFK